MTATGGASDQARVTLNFDTTQAANRNYMYCKLIVRVGLSSPTTNSGFASLYKVEIAQYDDGASGAPERYFNVIALAEKGAAGSWSPPTTGGFTFASSSALLYAFDIQNAATSTVDVNVVAVESNNVDSIVITKV